jgi:hypothetical protein
MKEELMAFPNNPANTKGEKRPAAAIRQDLTLKSVECFAIKNWSQFQHYHKRNPPWIKLHRALLDDYDFCSLPDAAKGHLMLLWLYASQNNGKVPVDVPFLEKKLSISGLDLSILIHRGFLIELGGEDKQL